MFLFSTFDQMRLTILYFWRAWFYLLASIPVIFLFPFLAIAAIHPKGYNFIFWCARYIWSPFILFLSGFYTKVDYDGRWRAQAPVKRHSHWLHFGRTWVALWSHFCCTLIALWLPAMDYILGPTWLLGKSQVLPVWHAQHLHSVSPK